MSVGDNKGILGYPEFVIDGKKLKVGTGDWGLQSEFVLEKEATEGYVIPFSITMKINGSESIYFNPIGNVTEVYVNSDYPDPSFTGDFIPVDRDVRSDGFTAHWSISKLTVSNNPVTDSFGVRLIEPVTQYRQTERCIKYGLLVIFLVFIAGFVVEIVSKRPISIIQYVVIGASLVMFYALLLAFSDFISFGLSYLIAATMTTVALGGYFISMLKNKWAYLLTALIALAYGVIYVLLRMETFAFLTGTLLLFAILCVIMALTRDLRNGDPETSAGQLPG